jgi:hypothetical protein
MEQISSHPYLLDALLNMVVVQQLSTFTSHILIKVSYLWTRREFHSSFISWKQKTYKYLTFLGKYIVVMQEILWLLTCLYAFLGLLDYDAEHICYNI